MGSRLSTSMKRPFVRSAHHRETGSACVRTDVDADDDKIKPSSMEQCKPIILNPPFTRREPLALDVINADVSSPSYRDSRALLDAAELETGEHNYGTHGDPKTQVYEVCNPVSENGLVAPVVSQDKETIDGRTSLFPINSDEERNPTSYLYRIMFDRSIPLLMLGESSQLSMTIAVSFMRGSFDGIYSSTYQLSKRPRNIEQIQKLVDRQRQEVRGAASRSATFTDLNDDDAARITLTIDATNLEAALRKYPDTPTDLIWFPFPCKVGKTAHGLLRGIIKSAASIQRNKPGGGVLLIGLSKNPAYTSRYGDIGAILRYAAELGYEHLDEECFMKTTCCEFGYRHRWKGQDTGGRSIHDKAINPSAIHIFILRPKLSFN